MTLAHHQSLVSKHLLVRLLARLKVLGTSKNVSSYRSGQSEVEILTMLSLSTSSLAREETRVT